MSRKYLKTEFESNFVLKLRITAKLFYNEYMKMNDVVFTNHAIDRMKERGISGDWAWQTVRTPERADPGKEKHTTEFTKKFGDHKITIIGKKNDIGEWVVLSAWMDPPLHGTHDYYKKEKYHRKMEKRRSFDRKMEKASFWGKMLLTLRKQLGV